MLSLKMVKGVELADGVSVEVHLPNPLTRFSIGRDPANQWPIPDRTLAISARHCEIVATPAGPALRDLSTNGTFVNGGSARLAEDHLLQDGDRIELGPYTILVQSPPLRPAAMPGGLAPAAARAPAAAAAAAASARPAAQGHAPGGALRGGDPAAMLSGGGPARPGLTEILRSAPPADDHNLAVTKIRAAPKPAAAPPMRSVALKAEVPPAQAPKIVLPPGAVVSAPAPAPAPVPTPAAPPPVAAAPVPRPPAAPSSTPTAGADTLLRPLAQGLGLAPDALAGRDPQQTATQVGQLARAGVMVLRHLLDLQAQARRQIGSRGQALLPVRDVNPLRLAPTPEAALLGLLAPGSDVPATLQRSAGEIAAHDKRLMAAYRGAAQRLGHELAPEALQAAVSGLGPASDTETKARLWELYQQLWQGMGLAPDQPWQQGFVEAALLHLAAAYDEQGKETAK
jgi:type VI secretion system FHA domain protein